MFYQIAKFLSVLPLKLAGAKVVGRENIPKDEAIVIICNHVSYGDPIAVIYGVGRRMTFIAKEEFANKLFTRWLFSALGAVFLKKNESDLGALRTATKKLKEGCAVGIFPEGRRVFDQKLEPFQPGAAFIAQQAQVRVVPMAVLNTGDYWRFWKRNIRIVIGEPIDPPPAGKAGRDARGEYTRLYQNRVEELLEQARRMVLADGRDMRHSPRAAEQRAWLDQQKAAAEQNSSTEK